MPGLVPRKYKDHRRYSYPRTFGTTQQLTDIDLDTGLANFNQNEPNPVTGDPALPNGCTAFTRADIATNEDTIIYKPGFTYEKACMIAGVPVGSPLPLEAAFKAGIDYGLQAVGETTDQQALTHRRGPYFEVHTVQGQDAFDALWSALLTGKKCLSVGSPWFPELTNGTTVDSITIRPTNDWHCWEALGVKTTDQPRLKVKAHTGDIKWFSRDVINALFSVNGSDCLTDTDGKATQADIQTVNLSLRDLLISYLERLISWYQSQISQGALEVIQPFMTPQDELYSHAKLALGTHKTLDPNVPNELGCAESWSTIAHESGVAGIPVNGFAGTAALDEWLATNPHFKLTDTITPGCTIISPTVGANHGHVGYLGQYDLQYNKDWGIISNDSATGIVREQWSYTEWLKYYRDTLGLVVHIYSYLG